MRVIGQFIANQLIKNPEVMKATASASVTLEHIVPFASLACQSAYLILSKDDIHKYNLLASKSTLSSDLMKAFGIDSSEADKFASIIINRILFHGRMLNNKEFYKIAEHFDTETLFNVTNNWFDSIKLSSNLQNMASILVVEGVVYLVPGAALAKVGLTSLVNAVFTHSFFGKNNEQTNVRQDQAKQKLN